MSFPRYARYRDSGVEWLGEVPVHWQIKRLRFAAELNPSKGEVASLNRQTEVSFLPMDAIGDDGTVRLDETRTLAQVENGYTYFRDGDVVIAKITPCFENGKGAVIRELLGGVGFGTTELIVVRPRHQHTTSDYLGWLFASPTFRKKAEGAMYGAGGQKRVPDSFVRDYLDAVPPLDEQSAIATFLDRETGNIDALITEQEKLLTLLAEKRQATISNAVTRGLTNLPGADLNAAFGGGPKSEGRDSPSNPNAPMKDSGVPWMGEVPAHWKVPPLYLRYTVELGKMLDTYKITGEHLTPYLRNVDVQWDRINTEDLPRMDISPNETSRFTVRDGDLLVCEGGEVGRAAVVSGLTIAIGYQKALHRLRSLAMDEDPRYMFFVFSWAASAGAFAGEGQSTIAHLTGEQLRKYRFPKPPLEEQQAIATFLDARLRSLDSLHAEAERMVGLLKERRSAVIAAAVTGKIDVREAA